MSRLERNALVVIAVMLALLWARNVAAQETDNETALILAQAFVAEAGFDAAEDHAAIAHVLARKADVLGIPLVEMAVRYVALLRVDRSGGPLVVTERASWVRGLALDARRPDGWPSHLAWSAHVDRWLATIERARAFLRGDLPDPCASRPAHWGMRSGVDLERAQRAGWVLARCSKRTANAFWSKP